MILRTGGGCELDPSVTIPSYPTLTGLRKLETGELADISRIDPLRDPRWNDLVNRHPKAAVFHSVDWLRALQREYGYQPVALCTSGSDRRLTGGLVFCRVKSWLTGTRLVSLPFSDHCEPLAQDASDLEALLRGISERASGKFRYAEIRPCSTELPAGYDGRAGPVSTASTC